MALFDDLPQQAPPSRIVCGNKALVECPDCRGSGRHRYSAFSGNYYAERFSEACPRCMGAGKLLRHRDSKPPVRTS